MGAVTLRIFLLLLTLLAAQTPRAEMLQRVVWADVTRVAPIIDTQVTLPGPNCGGPKPLTADLRDLLSWDLQPQCRSTSTTHTQGYVVDYVWDGRSYTTETIQHPGDRIALRLRLR